MPQNFGKLAVGYLQKLKERLEIAKVYASEHAENKQAEYVARYNTRLHDKSFEAGDQVMVPSRKTPYRIPESLRKESDRQVDELLEAGPIKPSDSPHACPVICVTKPNRSIRMCYDHRVTNSSTLDDAYSMKHAQDLLYRVGQGPYITTLNCSQGYYQIAMEPESIPKTAFVTYRGLYQWHVMSFGLKNAGSTYQRVIDKILDPHRDYTVAFIDDIAIHHADTQPAYIRFATIRWCNCPM